MQSLVTQLSCSQICISKSICCSKLCRICPTIPLSCLTKKSASGQGFRQDFTLGDLPVQVDEDEEEPIPSTPAISGSNKIPDKAAWALMQPLIDNESFPPGIVSGQDVENAVSSRNPRKTITGSPALRHSEYLAKDKPDAMQVNIRMLATAVIILVLLAIGVAVYLDQK